MVAINVVKEDLETLSVKIHLSGLKTDGSRYDLFRLQVRYEGKDDAGVRQYSREIPDRRTLWSSVAHRVGWQPPGASADLRDFDCPGRPQRYFICESAAGGPHEWDFQDGDYPADSRGILDDEIVHFNQDRADVFADPDEGHLVIRSVHELAHYADVCLVEMDGPFYTARVSEHAVLGSQFPVVISDSREGRRGEITVLTRNLAQYDDLRRVVFPPSGRIRPILIQAGGDRSLLLDDLRAIPLDVEVEQSTPYDPDLRFIHISYIETDPATPLIARSGDNDNLVNAPETSFTISDSTPRPGQWITIQDTSTGQGDEWTFSVPGAVDNKLGRFYGPGPHRLRYNRRGQHEIRLRFGGSGAGHQSRTKIVTVG